LRGRLTSDVVEEEIENVEASKALDTLGMRNDMRMILDSYHCLCDVCTMAETLIL
jgi:hypothetical protein